MSDLVGTIAVWSGVCFQLIGLFVLLARHSYWRACGWWSVTGFLFLLDDTIRHDRWLGVWNAIWTAYYLYTWWNGGGGDKTKRRLKKLAKKFSPVRRTAPSYGMEVDCER